MDTFPNTSIIICLLLPYRQYDTCCWSCHLLLSVAWNAFGESNMPICWNSSMQMTILTPLSAAIFSGRSRISSMLILGSFIWNCIDVGAAASPKLSPETMAEAYFLTAFKMLSTDVAVCLSTSDANLLKNSSSVLTLNISMNTTFRFGSLAIASLAALWTSELFPQRRGEMRMVFVRHMKLSASLLVSFSLSMKLLPSAIFPKIKGAAMMYKFWYKNINIFWYIKICTCRRHEARTHPLRYCVIRVLSSDLLPPRHVDL